VACRGSHHRTVQFLLLEGASQSTETSILSLTPLHYAAMFGHVKCIQILLNSEPEKLSTWSKGLHIAASCGWVECVKLLCTSGADLSKSYQYYLKLDDGKRLCDCG
jgi:ankyrin repeat protein